MSGSSPVSSAFNFSSLLLSVSYHCVLYIAFIFPRMLCTMLAKFCSTVKWLGDNVREESVVAASSGRQNDEQGSKTDMSIGSE